MTSENQLNQLLGLQIQQIELLKHISTLLTTVEAPPGRAQPPAVETNTQLPIAVTRSPISFTDISDGGTLGSGTQQPATAPNDGIVYVIGYAAAQQPAISISGLAAQYVYSSSLTGLVLFELPVLSGTKLLVTGMTLVGMLFSDQSV